MFFLNNYCNLYGIKTHTLYMYPISITMTIPNSPKIVPKTIIKSILFPLNVAAFVTDMRASEKCTIIGTDVCKL